MKTRREKLIEKFTRLSSDISLDDLIFAKENHIEIPIYYLKMIEMILKKQGVW